MEELSLWDPVEFNVGARALWRLGRLSVWVQRYEQAWHVLRTYAGDGDAESREFALSLQADKPDSTDWKHYLVKDGRWALPLPAMMDRPVIVRPDRELILPPGQRARFFIALPLWFALRAGTARVAGNQAPLFEVPIVPIANAWFGDPIAGELCYYVDARLYQDAEELPGSPVHAVCPLWIHNDSEKELSFDRFCLHTEFLGIYRGRSRLWTNEVSILFKGAAQATQVQPSKSAPDLDGPASLVREPRQAVENWYFKRSFDLLKHFTGF